MMTAYILLASAVLVAVTADLTARDLETISMLIGNSTTASEARLTALIVDSTTASEARLKTFVVETTQTLTQTLRDEISASQTQLKEFVVETLRDESHLFVKQSVAHAKACVHFLNDDVTGFGVLFNGRGYFITAKHVSNESNKLSHATADLALLHPSSPKYDNTFGFFNLTNAIANPSMGDTLFALGYDGNKPDVGLRLWVGSVYSVYDYRSVTTCTDETASCSSEYYTRILTGGDTVAGMSGAPVFNGCGISGVSVGMDLRHATRNGITLTNLSGTVVVHIKHLIELLSYPNASEFSVTLSESSPICNIPVKKYC